MEIATTLDLREQHTFTQRCEFYEKKTLEKIMPFALISHTKMPIVFGKGQPTNSIARKLAKLGKLILVLMNTSDVEKIKNRSEQNFEDEANNKQ